MSHPFLLLFYEYLIFEAIHLPVVAALSTHNPKGKPIFNRHFEGREIGYTARSPQNHREKSKTK